MRRLGSPSLSLGLMMLLAAACSNQPGPTRSRTFERQWTDASISKLDLSGVNGRIVLEPSADSTIRMTATMEIGTRLPANEDERLLDIRKEGSTLVIRDPGGPEDGGFFDFFDRDSVKTDFTVQVPSNLILELQTVNGRIRVDGVGSELQVTSVNGKIDVRSPADEIEAETVNGTIRVEYLSAFRGGKFKTVNGSVHVSVPPEASIDADVDQLNGSFQSNIPVIVDGDNVKTADTGSERFPLEVSTVNGSVTLTQRKSEQQPASTSAGT